MHIKKTKKKKCRNIVLGIFIVLVILLVSLLICLLPTYKTYKTSAYDVLSTMNEDTFRRNGNTLIYDKNNELIGKIGYERYEYVDISEISNHITSGYIAVEDQNFASHAGVDFKATSRAAFELIKNKGEITQGGSTITQQVVKNNLLTQERTYRRKILEIFLAFEVEKRFDKSKIMEFYCNSNFYGQNCYGVEAASQYYFGKSAKEVTLAEAAILVGTSNSPNSNNPVSDYERAMEKKQSVLNKMLEQGIITQNEYDVAVAEEPEIVQKTTQVDNDSYQISYAIHCAALRLMEINGFSFKYRFDSQTEYEAYEELYNETYAAAVNEVRTGGYKIYTSLNTEVQELLQETLDEELSVFAKKQDDGRYEMQGAAVCVDNETQMVIAIVGGRGTEDSYNRGYQAERQPGSAIKPLLDYGPAINEGVALPSTIYVDEPLDINGYKPNNASGGYRGKMTVREALARSINTIAVQLYMDTGSDVAMEYLAKMQFDSIQYADSIYAGVSIGGFTTGVSVDDMAKGYSMLANNGQFSNDDCILLLYDNTDEEIYSAEFETTEVFLEDTAFMLTDMMQGVMEEYYGTAHDYDTNNQNYAVKTGTTNDSKDAWFCGFSKYYTTAVWVGCDTPRPVDGLYGNTYPAKIWSEFMDEMHEDLDEELFDIPDSIGLQSMYSDKKIDVDYDGYDSRPSGYDYFSSELEKKYQLKQDAKKNEEILEKARKAVEAFEDFQITNVDEALSLEYEHNIAINAVKDVLGVDAREELYSRISYKYELLSGEVADNWQKAMEQAEKDAQELKDLENKEAAQDSLEAADKVAKQSLLDKAEWYIEHLKERTVYTDYVETLIKQGKSAVDACKDLGDYQNIKKLYDEAVKYVKELPTEVTEGTTSDIVE